MGLSSAAKQAGAPDDRAREFADYHRVLVENLGKLTGMVSQLEGVADNKNSTAAEARAVAKKLSLELAELQEGNLAAVNAIAAAYRSETRKDKGSAENVARLIASHDESKQHPLAVLVKHGVDDNATAIIGAVDKLQHKYPFLLERMHAEPDPHVEAAGLKPTIEQVITYAIHMAVAADNGDVFAALWNKLDYTAETIPAILMELYQGAGYYLPPGALAKLEPRPAIFALITDKDNLSVLSPKQLNALLLSMAGHKTDMHPQLAHFLAEMPDDKKSEIDYAAAFQAAACNETKAEIGSKPHVQALLPYVSQEAKNKTYETVACMQTRGPNPVKENPACIAMAELLLSSATKPLPVDTLAAIAKTGYVTNFQHALEHGNAAELPQVLCHVLTPPSVVSEENTLALMKCIMANHVKLDEAQLSMVLEYAVGKGQTHLLKALMDMPDIQPVLNLKESRSKHANEGGNKILYKAVTYNGNTVVPSAPEKRRNVETALEMLKILHNEGHGAEIPVIQGARGKGVLNIITQRIAQDAPELANDDYLKLLTSRLDHMLAGQRAVAEETARRSVHGAIGNGNPVEERRAMLAQLAEEANVMGLEGEERKAHIRDGLSTLGGPARLALGNGAPPPVQRVGELEILEGPDLNHGR